MTLHSTKQTHDFEPYFNDFLSNKIRKESKRKEESWNYICQR